MTPSFPAWLLARESPGQKCRRARRTGLLHKMLQDLARAWRAAGDEPAAAGESAGKGLDPRVKVIGGTAFVVLANLAADPRFLALLCGLALAAAVRTGAWRAPLARRAWCLAVCFAVLLALPVTCNWILPGTPCLRLLDFGRPVRLGPFVLPATLATTREGSLIAVRLILRLFASLTMAFTLAASMARHRLLAALSSLGVPGFLLSLLEMSHRYLGLMLRTALDYGQARESRTICGYTGREHRSFLGRTAGNLLLKANHLGEEIHMAMQSRGFTGISVAAPLPAWGRRQTWQTLIALILTLICLGGMHRFGW